jgi:hypothetical protein
MSPRNVTVRDVIAPDLEISTASGRVDATLDGDVTHADLSTASGTVTVAWLAPQRHDRCGHRERRDRRGNPGPNHPRTAEHFRVVWEMARATSGLAQHPATSE